MKVYYATNIIPIKLYAPLLCNTKIWKSTVHLGNKLFMITSVRCYFSNT